MTEAEWLAATDPTPMLEYIEDQATTRKWRLLACALCSTYRGYLTDERSWAAVEIACRVADGLVEEQERERAFVEAHSAANWTYDSDAAAEAAAYTCGDREQVIESVWRIMRACAFDIYLSPREAGTAFLRDLFGPMPFRLVTTDPNWRTSAVVALAEGIYADRAFNRLPILADALQDAGCGNDDLLSHLRSDGPHVRGCWALDLILGKS